VDSGSTPAPIAASALACPTAPPLPDAPGGRSRGNFDAIRAANEADGLHIDALTLVPRWDGEEMDPQLAVLELIQRE
jgi:hypothetical protein